MDDASVRAGGSPVGVVRGCGTRITAADATFLRTIGYTRADFESGDLDWQEMTPPEQLHLDEAGIQQALAAGDGFTAPYVKEFIRKDGTRVPVLLVSAFVPDTVGTWIGYVVDLSAPTPRHAVASDADAPLGEPLPADFYGRLVAELVRERARLVSLINSTDALVVAVDPQGRLLAANAAFQALQRLTSGRDMAIGEPLAAPEDTSPEVLRWKALHARALAGERFSTRTRLVLPGGARYLDAVLSPIVDARAGVVGVAVVCQDVTARVAVEDALRESEARFRQLAYAAPLGIFLAAPDGAGVYVNPAVAKIWGRPAAELLGSGWFEDVHPEDAERAMREWRAATSAAKELALLEYRLVLPDLGVRHVRVWASPVCDGDRVTGYVGSVEDATERHAQAARARQREKMESLGTLAGGIAHDFNNMLSVILGYTEVAIEEPGAGDLHISLGEIKIAATRARDLVRQILTFSRRTERADAPVDLGCVAAEGVRLLRSSLSVAIEVAVPSVPLIVRGDATALQQIVVNLCTNAAHAMRDRSGSISVRLEARGEPPDGEAVLTVRDAGCGIPADVRERLFEPFFTTKPVGEGTGMGLAVVHGIVTAHGGVISVESAPDAGSTFAVSLPLVSGVAVTKAPAPPAIEKGTGHLLIVEDERAIARLSARALERSGYTVAIASDGMEGLRMFSAAPDAYDVVLTDLAMPDLTGDKLARAIRVVRPRQRIILVSGYLGSLTAGEARDLGVSILLPKPFTQHELVDAVGRVLAAPR